MIRSKLANPKKKMRAATAADRRHMGRVAAMGCICCKHCHGIEGTPAQVHHVRLTVGWGREGHDKTIPLCPEHHTGKTGVHSMGRDEFTQLHGSSEIVLLAVVNEALGL